MKSSAPARIVNVSSLIHSYAKFNIENLNFENGAYNRHQAYACSKLANVLFTNALAKRLWGTGVTVNSLHPGVILSEFLRRESAILNWILQLYVAKTFFKTSKQGAATSLYLAASPDVAHVTGVYFADCRPKVTSLAGVDFQLAEDLWKRSEELVSLKKTN